jgi:hypothetical protein
MPESENFDDVYFFIRAIGNAIIPIADFPPLALDYQVMPANVRRNPRIPNLTRAARRSQKSLVKQT